MSRDRLNRHELFYFRNHIPITDVIKRLDMPFKISEGYTRFLCPVCKEFNTAVNPKTNLARCFLCEKNYNPIDLVITVKGLTFRDTISYLKTLRKSPPKPSTALTETKPKPLKMPCSVKNIIDSTEFPLKLPENITTKNSNPTHNEIIRKVNSLEKEIKNLKAKIVFIEQMISHM